MMASVIVIRMTDFCAVHPRCPEELESACSNPHEGVGYLSIVLHSLEESHERRQLRAFDDNAPASASIPAHVVFRRPRQMSTQSNPSRGAAEGG